MKKAYKFSTKEEKNQLVKLYGENHFDYVPNDSAFSGGGYMYHDSDSPWWTSGEPDKDALIVTFEEAMKKELKVGDKVRCIKKDAFIDLGNVYVIRELIEDYAGDGRLCIGLKGLPMGIYYADFFEQVHTLSLEEQITLAKSYIGKNVVSKYHDKYTVKKVNVILSKEEASNLRVNSENVLDGIEAHEIVVVVSNDEFADPVEGVELIPDITVYLNENYSAIVDKDTIKVGCQTFPISIIDDLIKARNELK